MKRLAALLLAVSVLSGCTQSLETDDGDGGPSATVALLLPERKASRYEAGDQPYFAQKLSELCPGCEVDYRNAEQSADTQLQQAKDALAKGAKVLVLTPVDSIAAGEIVALARSADVPVISYDRLVLKTAVDYYISFDNAKVGSLQAAALLQALGAKASAGRSCGSTARRPTTTRRCSNRARTPAWTARSASRRSRTPPSGTRTTRRPGPPGPCRRCGGARSSGCTPPTTARPVPRSPR
ncbi:hypothetical protein GCM10027610_002240 [Dactylosporangium cerinum]